MYLGLNKFSTISIATAFQLYVSVLKVEFSVSHEFSVVHLLLCHCVYFCDRLLAGCPLFTLYDLKRCHLYTLGEIRIEQSTDRQFSKREKILGRNDTRSFKM